MLDGTSASPATGPLVGRGAALDQLDAGLDAVAAGAAVCFAVEGEPGIGKSRLLAELRARAEARGYLVLSGSAAEFERDLAYGVWVEALDAFVASRRLDDAELAADLASVLPSSSNGGDRPPSGDERHRAHRAIRRLLALVAEREPLVLVLDDLHWSDAASVALIATVLRRGVAPRVLLALAYRAGRAPPGLLPALTAPAVTVIELDPLSEDECGSLAGAELGARRQATIFRESGGNPFYALQLAHAARRPVRSSTADRMAADVDVPRTVAAALVEELDALGADARRLLDAGSIAGDPFEPELAFEIAELETEAGMVALDELLDTRLLQPTAVPRRFAFRHPLVRRAVYESTGGGWRLIAHARAAAAQAGHGASAATRAHHVEQSARRGDADAIELLLEAGAATAPRAPAVAARWFAAALRLLPDADQAARLRTQIALAQAQRSTGDLDRCVATLLEALELVPAGDTRQRVALTAACAASEHFLGRHEQAERRLIAALDSLVDPNSRDGVVLLLALAAGGILTLDHDRGRSFARRALTVAHALDDGDLIGAAASALAHACANAGVVPELTASVDEAARRLDAVTDDALARSLDAVNRLTWAEFLVDRYEDADRHGARGVAVARATGQDQFVPMIAGAHALSAMRRGDLAAAWALQDDALETAEVAGNDYITSWVLTIVAHVCMATGDLESARRAAERAVALVGSLADSRITAIAQMRLAATRHEMGDDPDGVAAVIRTAGGWDFPRITPCWIVFYAEAIARVELAAGRLDDGERLTARAEATARDLGLPLAGAIAQRGRAAVHLARHEPAEAARLALASAAAAGAAGAPIEAATSHALAGRAFALAGKRPRAVELLRSAETVFDSCGAARERGQARHELRRLGARAEPRGPSGGDGDGLESLSRREREVADLITARKTNREVAAELFLSEKTVESHLRNIFAKLGASSRVEVARAVERSEA
jgi:DNA-binding NarL/FixJ family response regulator